MANAIPGFFTILILLTCMSACQTNQQIHAGQLEKGIWKQITSADGSLPEKRHEAAFIGIGGKMYLMGGRGMKPVSIYDPGTNTWNEGAVAPIELHHFQPAVYGGEVYIIGAMTGGYPGETPVEEIYVYNPQSDLWRIEGKISPERARGGAGVIVNDHTLFLICGIKDGHRGDHKKWLDAYDLKKKTWKVLPDAPRARDHFQAAFVDGRIYAIGGRTTIAADNPFKNTIGAVDVYDLANGHWSTLPDNLPTLRAGNSVLVMQEEILVFGGESFTQEPAHAEVEALNINTHKWKSLPPMIQGRHGTGVIHYRGALYTSSGSGNRGGGPELADLLKFDF